MKPVTIKPCKGLQGTLVLPGDKSISHRAVMLAALSRGKTVIKNFLFSDDCLVTLRALEACGVSARLDKKKAQVVVVSDGILKDPRRPLFMKESGTSARILMGLLSGQGVSCVLTGLASLTKRPMQRVIEPLSSMGARIRPLGKPGFLPVQIAPSELRGITWNQKVASAQVKSAIILAGLGASGRTVVLEREKTRDHTERMLKLFGADAVLSAGGVTLRPGHLVSPKNIFIPGDISSALFFVVAALITPGSHIVIKDVGINPTRMGAIRVLMRMGGWITISRKRDLCEPVADLEVSSSSLKGTVIKREEIPALIDELPILMVAAAFASGKTVINGVDELRVKETDRIRSMASNLTKLGVNVKVRALKETEVIDISCGNAFKKASFMSFGDHRTAMSMVVAALGTGKGGRLDDISCVKKSFPGFLVALNQLLGK